MRATKTPSLLQLQIAELEKSSVLLDLLVKSMTVPQRVRYFKICQDILSDSSLMRILKLSEEDFK